VGMVSKMRRSRPPAPPWNWGKQQSEREQAQTHAPSDALARPRAHFAHDELFTLAHFSVGFEE
jgi:hypothetical protein